MNRDWLWRLWYDVNYSASMAAYLLGWSHRFQGGQVMPVVGGRHDDRVDVLPRADLAVILGGEAALILRVLLFRVVVLLVTPAYCSVKH